MPVSLDDKSQFVETAPSRLGLAQGTAMDGMDDSSKDLEFPQREAAFFYGLFLRGHSPDELRRDISVPPEVLAKWSREMEQRPETREVFDRIVEFRRHVLAIFDSLLTSDTRVHRLQ